MMTPGESTAEEDARLRRLEAALGVQFRDRTLLARALTHHSAATSRRDSYDTLEFLGDALIGARVVEQIFRAYPAADEGEMTALKSEVVSRRVLGLIGERLNLDEYVRVNVSALRTFNERSRLSLRADALEALVAAIHLDQGRDEADAFITREIFPMISKVKAAPGEHNPKGALQERTQRHFREPPRYETLAQGGTSNDRRYIVGVYAGNRLLATGRGTSLKEAQREAARAALRAGLGDGRVRLTSEPPQQ